MNNIVPPDPTAYLFGYGSLLNPRSIEKTLGRPIAREELRVVRLYGYRRVWNLVDDVIDERGKQVSAVFLNLEPAPGSNVVGLSFPVTPTELTALDLRERNYDRADVTAAIEPSPATAVYTYVGKKAHHITDEKVAVMQRYEAVIEEALQFWGEPFARAFRETTTEHLFQRRGGPYSFAPR